MTSLLPQCHDNFSKVCRSLCLDLTSCLLEPCTAVCSCPSVPFQASSPPSPWCCTLLGSVAAQPAIARSCPSVALPHSAPPPPTAASVRDTRNSPAFTLSPSSPAVATAAVRVISILAWSDSAKRAFLATASGQERPCSHPVRASRLSTFCPAARAPPFSSPQQRYRAAFRFLHRARGILASPVL